jgi:hypothetical protein
MKRILSSASLLFLATVAQGCGAAGNGVEPGATMEEQASAIADIAQKDGSLTYYDTDNLIFVPPRSPAPPMGWNSWNQFGCGINETIVKQQADAMVSSGLFSAGYRFVNIDDCWQANQRNADGTLSSNPARFPNGIKALADYLHDKGLKLGIYSSPGSTTCTDFPGSKGHETSDATQFAAWGVDYLKYDRCSASSSEVGDAFLQMRHALDATGRTILFSINPNGATYSQPWSNIADLWRTTPDIKPVWDSTGSWYRGMINNADINADLAMQAWRGAWNDPDMLEIGVTSSDFPGLSFTEERVHMTLWAIMAAPLITGTNLATMSNQTRELLTNPEVVAVDQDTAGIQGWRVRDEGDNEVWMKPLNTAVGTRAVAFVNRSSTAKLITVYADELHLASLDSAVRDLWNHRDLVIPSGANQVSMSVGPHDAVLVKITGPVRENVYEAESPFAIRKGGAVKQSCPSCGGAVKVGYIGNGGTLTFHQVYIPTAGTRVVSFYYASGSSRDVVFRVDGGTGLRYTMPSTGSFLTVHRFDVALTFQAGWNSIELSNPSGAAPDFDRLVVP